MHITSSWKKINIANAITTNPSCGREYYFVINIPLHWATFLRTYANKFPEQTVSKQSSREQELKDGFNIQKGISAKKNQTKTTKITKIDLATNTCNAIWQASTCKLTQYSYLWRKPILSRYLANVKWHNQRLVSYLLNMNNKDLIIGLTITQYW